MKRLVFISAVLLFGISECTDRVLLRDVTSITLTEGAWTNGRRSSPVPQLTCIGGSAQGKVREPGIVQCKNVGFDGSDVQWECTAEFDARVLFGSISVSCEGYDYSEDPFVLRSSCGLEYELDWISDSDQSGGYSGINLTVSLPSITLKSITTFLKIAFIVFIICLVICLIYDEMRGGSGANPDPPGFRSGFDHGAGSPPADGGHPGSSGNESAPRCEEEPSSTGDARPTCTTYHYRRSNTGGCRSSSSSSQPTKRTAAGFGGTKRR